MVNLDLFCWVVLISALVTSFVALVGLISSHYNETLLENLALVGISFSGVVIALQIGAKGMTMMSGVASMMAFVALYSVAILLRKRKEFKDEVRHHCGA